ncbi:MAG: ABC transporter permease [SAR324 cluster bacterium]|nr:ABC transporter permease [SAR324 cluster bacterium]
MRLELAICLRYLRSSRSDGAISFITWVALLGVVLGVAALVVAMAVMNGYQTNLVRVMASSLPHVSLTPVRSGGIQDEARLLETLRERYHPLTISPYLMQESLVRAAAGARDSIQGVMIRGIEPKVESEIPEFLAFLDDGSEAWKNLPQAERQRRAAEMLRTLENEAEPGVAPVLLSRSLARKLGVGLGGRLIPLEMPNAEQGFSPMPVAQQLTVVGYFETGLTMLDELVLVTHRKFVPALMPGKALAESLGIRIANPLDAGQVARELRALSIIGNHGYYVYSWLESNKGIFQVIRMQKVMLFLVLMLIVVIAFFGMMSALTMMVTDKTKEIAVLKSLGAKGTGIMMIFLGQGLLIGFAGTVLGLGLGLLLSGALDTFPLIDIPPGVYPGTDKVPVQVAWLDLAWVAGGTMVVCLAATILPARKALALQPVDGLRYG